jgi:TPR repeat protein/transcriptional regulator with XRE-family HTH domain
MAMEDDSSPAAALAELRARLEYGLAELGITKTALARRSKLGRTAVSEAFNRSAPAPSARTVGALARALHLDVEALLKLRTTAAGVQHRSSEENGISLEAGIGRPITEFDPHDLEVHPAIDVVPALSEPKSMQARRLPGYVRRNHDGELKALVKAAADGQSGMVVLVGPSSTGKTRACWEAIQPLASHGWRLWHPFDPTRAEAALNDLKCVGPRTVVWLNETQHYIGAGQGVGEHIAATLRSLLLNRQAGPILILGTLWNNYATEYTALPASGKPDLYPQTRELLAGRLISVPDNFDTVAIRDARILASAGDPQLAQALNQAQDGRLTQYLAGAPALSERYRMAAPAVRALIQAAMDGRRFGVGNHIAGNFLAHAAEDYLTDPEYLTLRDNWLYEAFCESNRPVHGNLAPLAPVRIRGASYRHQLHQTGNIASSKYRLADSLEQLGRLERNQFCPPVSFWEAAHEYLTDSVELANLAVAAHDRHRLYWAHRLTRRVEEHGDASALIELADMWMEEHLELAESLYRRSAEMGNARAMSSVGYLREDAGDRDEAKEWYRKASEAGDGEASYRLAEICENLGDAEKAERLYRQALDLGDTEALGSLGRIVSERGGDEVEAISLFTRSILLMVRQAARATIGRLDRVTGVQDSSIGPWGSEKRVTNQIVEIEEKGDAGDLKGFIDAVADASRNGDTYGTMCHYLLFTSEDGDEAERMLERAGRDGNTYALIELANKREKAGKLKEAEALYRALIGSGNDAPLALLANLMKKAGNLKEAESLYWRAIEAGNTYALCRLSELKEYTGDHAGAVEIALQAANAGDTGAVRALSKERASREGFDDPWPYGLDPDGTPTVESW